ncbi:hypothetical protein CLOHYLEM_04445 [[Clostridium] hylemonae DSM 15053]|uniref:Uncharacterized protein n=1 Tax=[Clostridium] hylemonae DSM 15053 TaxID=553973 RepID=C0BXA8_9FIRM|nr:hypothetical protein CLOHYLEM_04445 [[Clostridium] hylemonae DSM 15053]
MSRATLLEVLELLKEVPLIPPLAAMVVDLLPSLLWPTVTARLPTLTQLLLALKVIYLETAPDEPFILIAPLNVPYVAAVELDDFI